MLTQENDVEIHALHARGWNQSAISRHTGRDRKTIRRYLAAGEEPLVREAAASCLEPWRAYIAERFVDDPHLPAVTLLDELSTAGFDRSYPTLVRELRRTALRPVCLVCQQRRGNAPTTEIDHPPGEEIQWDWLELPATPWEQPAYLLVGALSHSGRFRAVFCEQMTFGYLAGALHEILAGLGGTARVWRVDRMATAVIADTDRLNPQFAQMAKHYGVDVAICPPHRPQRKGVVEAAIKFIGGRWWRTVKVASLGDAQQSLDAFAINVSDRRGRRGSTVGYASQPLTVRARVGEPYLRIVTTTGIKVATHRRAPAGAEQTIRTSEHAAQLERAVLDAFTTKTTCRSKINRPPGDGALAELAKLHGQPPGQVAPVVSLSDYAKLAEVAC
jgi:transposase